MTSLVHTVPPLIGASYVLATLGRVLKLCVLVWHADCSTWLSNLRFAERSLLFGTSFSLSCLQILS